MFEEYLEDAYYFYNKANDAQNEKEAKRYYRASVFCTANAVEAFVNYTADTLSNGSLLYQHEIAFLRDKKYVFQGSDNLGERNEFHSIEDKLGFLIKKFSPTFDLKSDAGWKTFTIFKDFRNDLVHPRKPDDDTTVGEYQNALRNTIRDIINIMNIVSLAMFNQPLRKKLLDLIPD